VRGRVGRYLERQGLLQRDAQHSYLAGERIDEGPMNPLWGHSITWRIAVGPQAGRKVLTLQTLPADDLAQAGGAGNVGGFSLHAGVAVRANQPNKRERLCRYIARPALSEQRLSLTAAGKVRYQLKTPWRNGTTHVVYEPLDFLAKLAALVPRPRVNLTRYHGVFAPNSAHRALVTKAGRGRAQTAKAAARTPAERRSAMTWAQRLARVFGIDIKTCTACAGTLRIVASIEDPAVIKAILAHLAGKARAVHAARSPPGRAPPAPVVS
jgi:ribosomal protein S30